MEKADIKQIADYLKDLEEGLYEWDYRGLLTLSHLTRPFRRNDSFVVRCIAPYD
jgi:hypothetical protein